MGRQKIRQLTLSAWSITIFVILFVVMFLSWMCYHFLQPFPPKTLTMATGMEGGSYAAFGERYRQVLARDGIRLALRPTSGAVENLKLLLDRRQAVEAGFIQGTVGSTEERANLVSLGGLAYTPLWIFYKGRGTYDDLIDLKGKRIAIGPEGSGIRKYSLELLKVAGVAGPPSDFLDLPSAKAKQALLDGTVDAIMTFGSPDNRLIWELLNERDIKLMSMSEAEAYTRRLPDLSHVVLPRGIIDPGRRDPPSDVHLLSPTMNLIVRKDLHPALVYLLLKASVEINGGPSWVNKAGEFPTLTKQDDPISEQAQRFYKSGGSWLYAYLPFWAATFFERLTLILISLGMIIVPLIGIAPWIYTWRNRSKYYPWYRELRKLEADILENRPIGGIESYEARLDRMEDSVSRIRTSVAFYDELFILKEHIQIVRQKLRSSFRPPRGRADEDVGSR
jgi:TRAP-type uncharacterized transport system substrate-binding protein